jgi:hypothetical protein
MVDGQGPYWPPRHGSYPDLDARLEVVDATKGFSFLVSDATEKYREFGDESEQYAPGAFILDEFRRYVLFVRPDYLVMVDRVCAAAPHRYDWICHFSEDVAGSVTVAGEWVKGAANADDVLGVRVVQPAAFAYELGETAHVNGPDPKITKPYVRIRPQQDAADTVFTTVLYPTFESEWNNRPDVTLLQGANDQGTGVRVDKGDGVVRDHLFKYDVAATEVTVDQYRLQGLAASLAKKGDALLQVFVSRGKALYDKNGDHLLVQLPGDNKTLEAVYEGGALALYGQDLSGTIIYAPGVDPGQVTVNGNPCAATSPQPDYLELD